MWDLRRLSADHEPAVLAFELANRAYFAASISDRGDDYFAHFAARHAREVAEQEGDECAYYVLLEEDEGVVGRFNLRHIASGTAVLGYRVAQQVSGRGVASRTVERLCRDAAKQFGLREIRAATSDANAASLRVLEKTGFVRVGPADPAELGGKEGWSYVRRMPGRATRR